MGRNRDQWENSSSSYSTKGLMNGKNFLTEYSISEVEVKNPGLPLSPRCHRVLKPVEVLVGDVCPGQPNVKEGPTPLPVVFVRGICQSSCPIVESIQPGQLSRNFNTCIRHSIDIRGIIGDRVCT